MLVEVKVPQLSESVSEATLLAWHKKQGEAVKRDENLIDIETDKVVLELPAPLDGVLTKIVKSDGTLVTSGEVIAVIDTAGIASLTLGGLAGVQFSSGLRSLLSPLLIGVVVTVGGVSVMLSAYGRALARAMELPRAV